MLTCIFRPKTDFMFHHTFFPYPQLHWVQLPFSQRHSTAADLWLKTTAKATLSWTGEFLQWSAKNAKATSVQCKGSAHIRFSIQGYSSNETGCLFHQEILYYCCTCLFYRFKILANDYWRDLWISKLNWSSQIIVRPVIHICITPPASKAIQYSTDHHSQEKPRAAQSLYSLQEGTPLSWLRWMEQAEAFHSGPASAPTARVRISQMGSTRCEHKLSWCIWRETGLQLFWILWTQIKKSFTFLLKT